MKIRTRLKILISVLVVFIALLITVDVISDRHLHQRIRQLDMIADINQTIFKVDVLTNDYLLHYSERSMQQWYSVYKEMGAKLAVLEIKDVPASRLDDLETQYQELGHIFSTIVASYAKSKFANPLMRQLHDRLRERETTRLLLLDQEIQRDIFQLRALANQKIIETQVRSSNVKFFLELTFLLFVIVNAFLIHATLVGPIEQIHKGTEIVGAGNFDHKIPVRTPGHDEINQLAQAFNTMTGRLKSITASRDEIDRIRKELASQTEQLKASNTELEHFAYIASHDLQEPLSNVLNFSNLLEKRYADKLEPKAKTFIEQITDSSMRMRNLINDLLMYSRIDHKDPEKTPVDCNQLLQQVLKGMLEKIESIGGRITWDRLPTINAHESSMLQLFQNLIGNAVKFRRDDPIRIHVSAHKKEDEWIFSIADNGVGIEPHYYEKIFVMFQRLHSQSEYSGTGIGLAICKKIVEKHHGRIWVESEAGKGSTFYFSIPA